MSEHTNEKELLDNAEKLADVELKTAKRTVKNKEKDNEYSAEYLFHKKFGNEEYKSPVYNVLSVPIDKIVANDYNPNSVDEQSMQLLYDSIYTDGYTMPVVCSYDKEKDTYILVDGFHRFLIMKTHEDIYKREHGKLPVVLLYTDDEANRMSSTIRHNRARGTHDINIMSSIVGQLHKLGRTDKWIKQHLGMSEDEVLRLKQITGLADLFAGKEFSKSWEPDD